MIKRIAVSSAVIGTVACVAGIMLLGGNRPGGGAAAAPQGKNVPRATAGAGPAGAGYSGQLDWGPPRTKELVLGSDATPALTLTMDANRLSRPDGDAYFVMIKFETAFITETYYMTPDDARSLFNFYNTLGGSPRAESDVVSGASIAWNARVWLDIWGAPDGLLTIRYDYEGSYKTVGGFEQTSLRVGHICNLLPQVLEDVEALKKAPRSPLP